MAIWGLPWGVPDEEGAPRSPNVWRFCGFCSEGSRWGMFGEGGSMRVCPLPINPLWPTGKEYAKADSRYMT